MALALAKLAIPGVERSMCVGDADAIAESAIVVSRDPLRPTISFDASVLSSAFGSRWSRVERAMSGIEPANVHRELRRIAALELLPSASAALFAEAEVALLEHDPLAIPTLVLVLVQARINEALAS